ncbi:MAG TPA: hypothetical protein VK541_09820 [Pedobacter sp.]|uniref:hypothetical protein n=1 Tax=Pedobacter sp. TaxID=1411316 RepID=UPI002B9F9EE1|nr:hypothetical protein [Pedobacter sp.]HMI02768.1 hypothetical protein [Pedobacter sp.]
MKSKNLPGLAIALFLFVACQKDMPLSEPQAPSEILKDSASFTIDGKAYTSGKIEKGTTLTTQSNLKITSGVNFNYLLQGDKDSILFVRDYTIKANGSFMIISFIKVYSNSETESTQENNGGYLYYPKNKTDMFSVGRYKYSTDFWRDNSISGIAIRVISDRGDLKSYSQSDLGKPASVTQADQKESKFEIISLQKRDSGYLLEAKFNLNVFDENKRSQKIENGYLRCSVLVIY